MNVYLWFVLYGAWVVLLLYWLVSAPFSLKTLRRESIKTRAPVLALNVIVYTLLFLKFGRESILSSRILPAELVLQITGLVILWCGIALAIWARKTIGAYWSMSVSLKEGHKLITNGPYVLVRHPIYTGLLAAVIGTALAIGELRGLIAVVLYVPTYIFKLKLEEKILRENFGAAYTDYCAHTKALLPYIW